MEGLKGSHVRLGRNCCCVGEGVQVAEGSYSILMKPEDFYSEPEAVEDTALAQGSSFLRRAITFLQRSCTASGQLMCGFNSQLRIIAACKDAS